MMRNGMQMRIDEANDAGGVNGRKLRLIVEDNGSQPQMAVRAVQKLIKRTRCSPSSTASAPAPTPPRSRRAVEPALLCSRHGRASAMIQKVSGKSPLLFTTVPNYDSTTATGLSWAIKNWGSKKVGVIYQEGPFGDLVRAWHQHGA